MDLLNIPLPEFLPDCDKFSTVDYYETKRGCCFGTWGEMNV